MNAIVGNVMGLARKKVILMRLQTSAVRNFCALAIAASLTAGAYASTPAQAAAVSGVGTPCGKYVPADAAFYMGWAGKPEKWPGYQSSRLAKILKNSHIADFFSQDIPAILAARARGNPGTMRQANHAGKMASLFFNHPFAVYVLPLAPGQSKLSIGILVDAGKDRDKIIGAFHAMQKQQKYTNTKQPMDAKIGYYGSWVYDFINPTSEMMQAFAGKADPLAASKRFQKAIPLGITDPVLDVYLDFAAAKSDELLLAGYAKRVPQARMYLGNVDVGTQDQAYKSYGMTAGFVDGQWRQDNFVAYQHPPVHSGRAISLLKLAPVNAVDASVFHLNLTTIANGVLAAVKARGDSKMVNQGLQTVNEMTGVDLQQDLIHALGARWLMYELPTPGLPAFNGYVLANRLRHPNRIMQALAVLMPVAVMGGNAMARQRGMSAKTLSLNSVQMGDVTINEIGAAGTQLCYVIDNNNFFITLNLKCMRAAITQEKAKTSVLDNPAFKHVLAELNNPPSPATVSFTDSPKLVSAGYKLLTKQLQTMLTKAGIQLPLPLARVAPPLMDLIAAMKPSGSASWFDSAGWHQRSISAFPLAGIFTAQSPSHYASFFSSAWTAKYPGTKTAAAPARDSGTARNSN